MNLYQLQGRAELADRHGVIKNRATRAYVVAETEEKAIALVEFSVDRVQTLASSEENAQIREKLFIQKTSKR